MGVPLETKLRGVPKQLLSYMFYSFYSEKLITNTQCLQKIHRNPDIFSFLKDWGQKHFILFLNTYLTVYDKNRSKDI